ncbi:hypothetical protein WME97_30060 [Sorangium sp. So ce367]|uniref:hypothetical protein n=1 Tax=Sorangium sp. So ce367 TaxID=3133305 RepID=UPI003F61C3B3
MSSFASLAVTVGVGCVADTQDPEVADLSEEDTASAEAAMLSSSSTQGFGWVWSTLTGVGTINANSSYSHDSAGGAPVNTYFVALSSRENNSYGGAYLGNDQASAPLNVPYTPSTTYQYTSGNQYSTITHVNTGRYTVRVPGMSATGGTVHVTAYGGGMEYCNVSGWNQSGADTLIDVGCWGAAGASADSLFSLSYHLGMPSTGRVGGFAWASDPVSSSYTPTASYTGLYNTLHPCYFGPGISAGHNAPVGSHFVRYPNMLSYNSTAMVTAYGYGNQYCKVSYWTGVGSDTQVNVQCYDYLGNPVNSQFTNTYLGAEMFTPC